MSDFAKGKLADTGKELCEERDEAMAVCKAWTGLFNQPFFMDSNNQKLIVVNNNFCISFYASFNDICNKNMHFISGREKKKPTPCIAAVALSAFVL